MNSLLVFPDELLEPHRAVLTGARVEYFRQWHAIEPGIEVSALLYGEGVGRATVLEVRSSEVHLEVSFSNELPERLPIDLIIGVPRPQTVKKVLQSASTFGIRSIHFLRTKNVVKSYLESKSLDVENVRLELVEGMEQGGDPVPPQVHVHPHLGDFLKLHLPAIQVDAEQTLQLIADTRAESRRSLAQVWPEVPIERVVLALGPESGWDQSEVERFEKEGFTPLWLSQRMLRVETALTTALGQLELFVSRESRG